MLGTSGAWSMRRSSHQPSNQVYYIEDLRILRQQQLVSSDAAHRAAHAKKCINYQNSLYIYTGSKSLIFYQDH